MNTLRYKLKRLPFLVTALLLLAAAAPAMAAAQKAWLYDKGSFKPAGGTAWVEKNPTATFYFREVARTAQYVELYDGSRKMSVRLYATTMYWYTPERPRWNYLYNGRWTDSNKRPLDETRLAGERGRLESPTGRREFPHLGRDYEVLGPATPTYNCIAWSIGVTNRWVWPGDRIEDFDRLYGQNGYRRVASLDYSLQPGVEKIVLYAKRKPDGGWSATHGARQLADGSWSSKLGQLPLVRHLEPDDLDGATYGVPVAVYIRAKRT